MVGHPQGGRWEMGALCFCKREQYALRFIRVCDASSFNSSKVQGILEVQPHGFLKGLVNKSVSGELSFGNILNMYVSYKFLFGFHVTVPTQEMFNKKWRTFGRRVLGLPRHKAFSMVTD